MTQRRLDVLTEVLEAFNRHDLDAIMARFAEDCVLETPRGPDPWGCRFVGKSEVRQGLEPIDTETVDLPGEARTAKGIRVDKLVAKVGLAPSISEAVRKLKEGAVEVNGERVTELVLTEKPGVLVIRVGKKWKRVRVG